MSETYKRILLIILASYFIVLLIFFVVSILSFQEKEILRLFYWDWVIDNTLIEFSKNIVPVHCTAILISYSLIFPASIERSRKGISAPFHKLISTALVIFLVLTLFYMLLNEWVLPGLHRHQQDRIYNTTIAREFIENGKQARKEHSFKDALGFYKSYLQIDPENAEIESEISEISKQIINSESNASDETSIPVEERQLSDHNADELFARAEAYFRNLDFYSAHYYFSLAYKIDNSRIDAQRLASRAWGKISEYAPDKADAQKYALYDRKKDAYSAFTDGNYFNAYYLFKALYEEDNTDPDFEIYLGKSLQKVKEESFFIDEVEQIKTFPGVRDIVLLNRNEDTGFREILSFGKLVKVYDGEYLFDIEAAGFMQNGTILYHLKAPYGKIIENNVVMQCISREIPGDKIQPEYLVRNKPSENPEIINIMPDSGELQNFNINDNFLQSLNLPELWELRSLFSKYGLPAGPVEIEALYRISLPFGFLFLSLLSIAIGWYLRIRISPPPGFYYILILTFPFVLNVLIQLFFYFSKILFGFIYLVAGFGIGITAIIIISGLFIFGAILLLAIQTVE